MIKSYIRMAWRSMSASKWRSLLTMLGVLIGVLSVVTIVSLGEGVKQKMIRQISSAGSDLITVRPGQLVKRNTNGKISDVNLLGLLNSGSLTEMDITTIQTAPNVGSVAPFGIFTGNAEAETVTKQNILFVGTTEDFPTASGKEMLYGSFFTSLEISEPIAVIGPRIAEQLFRENSPIGRKFKVRGQEIIVRGVLERFENNPLTPGYDYNDAIFLPYNFAKKLTNGQLQNYQVLVRPAKGVTPNDTVAALTTRLASAHGNQTDFTVLQAAETLVIADSALNLLTAVVGAIAAISLLVGGIGIMNIMLVAVSERTHEIGIRKSVGATNQQILGQFLTEAIMLSVVGATLGVLTSLLANYFLRLWTSLEPVISIQVVGIALIVAITVGSFFGIMPALKAARKDPIEALRRG